MLPCTISALSGSGNLPFLTLAGLLGLVLGSFYALCAVRGAAGTSVIRPGSHCIHCGHPLRLFELVPVLSYVALRGRCARCDGPISPAYPLTELASATWAVLVARLAGPTPLFIGYLLLGGLFIILAGIDLRTFRLPDQLTFPAALIGIGLGTLRPDVGWLSATLGAAAGAGTFWLIAAIYRAAKGEEGLGGGDIKLMLSIGGVVGLAGLPYAILIASLAALCASPCFIRGDARSLPIPFGPFLCFGAMVQILFGRAILGLLSGT